MIDDRSPAVEEGLTNDRPYSYIRIKNEGEDGMRERIDRAIAQGKHASLGRILEGSHNPEHRYAARKIVEVGPSLKEALAVAESLAERSEAPARHVACQLVPEVYTAGKKRAARLLHRLVDDEDRAVRDAASEVCGRLLRADFPAMLEVLHSWCSDRSENVRRAVGVAAGHAALPEHPEWAEPLLKLLEGLLEDRDRLVRRSIPPVIGGSLLSAYPILTFEYIVRWSTASDQQVLWNVAMALSTPAAAGMVKKALIVLRKLSLDERRYVWRAVASAMWKLGRKRPEIVRPELARWLEEERRVDVAREALKYI